jgi:UDP-2,3-diacylglucosamine pyrophosphatase LpxH
MLHGLPASTASLFRAAERRSSAAGSPPARRFYPTLFLSDLHLGCSGSRAEPLARLLERLDCRKLYLVGDIVDLWQLRRRFFWDDACDRVVGRLVELAKSGCQVIFIPGNHDDAARRYEGVEIAGIEIKLFDVHTCRTGKRLLVTHGDQYDLVVKHSRAFCLLGDAAYGVLLRINTIYNRLRALFGRPYWSLSHYVKLKVKSACTFISRFEETLLHEAQREGLDGVVCGHIHKAEERQGELAYFNCGDWVESCSLIAEGANGKVALVDGLKLLAELEAEEREATFAAVLAS